MQGLYVGGESSLTGNVNIGCPAPGGELNTCNNANIGKVGAFDLSSLLGEARCFLTERCFLHDTLRCKQDLYVIGNSTCVGGLSLILSR